MLKIAICDDEEVFREELRLNIKRCSKEENISCQTDYYCSGQDIVTVYEKQNACYDILFLDVRMPGMDGIETAKKIRTYDKDCIIVFITSAAEMAIEGYYVNAFRYMIKLVLYAKFHYEFLEIVNQAERLKAKWLTVSDSGNIAKIKQHDIVYIETEGRRTKVHTSSKECFSEKKIAEWTRELCEDDFVRCHISFLVNLDYVEKLEQGNLFLQNGDRIPLSKHRKKEFTQLFYRHRGGMV